MLRLEKKKIHSGSKEKKNFCVRCNGISGDGRFASSLLGNVCQCSACRGMLAVPAWDACQFPAWDVCQFHAWKRLLLGHCPQVSYFLMLIGQA